MTEKFETRCLRNLMERAPAGPWQSGDHEESEHGGASRGISSQGGAVGWQNFAKVVTRMNGDEHDTDKGTAAFELILAMRRHLPALLDAYEQLQKAQARGQREGNFQPEQTHGEDEEGEYKSGRTLVPWDHPDPEVRLLSAICCLLDRAILDSRDTPVDRFAVSRVVNYVRDRYDIADEE